MLVHAQREPVDGVWKNSEYRSADRLGAVRRILGDTRSLSGLPFVVQNQDGRRREPTSDSKDSSHRWSLRHFPLVQIPNAPHHPARMHSQGGKGSIVC